MSTVLIVDDHVGTCAAMARLVEHAGHHGQCVRNGEEALARLQDIRPDLIILDYMMPGMSGLDVLREIRRDPRTADVPIVMYSAVGDKKIQDYARAQGANDYWIKMTMDVPTMMSRINALISPPSTS